jgi:uncharacterized RDD family membrane protein YckC
MTDQGRLENCLDCGKPFTEAARHEATNLCASCFNAALGPAPVLKEPAGPGWRFLNLLFDGIIIGVILVALTVVLMIFISVFFGAGQLNILKNRSLVWTACLVTAFAYYFVSETAFGRTPAKFITGTEVVDEAGGKPSTLALFKRTVCRFIPFEPVSFFFGRVGWHDGYSETRVVRTDAPAIEPVDYATCGNCGHVNEPEDTRCRKCGHPLLD